MQQYTTEWAKEYLRGHEYVLATFQDKDGTVYKYRLLTNDYYWFGGQNEIGKMLEHPDGWENSLVTREEL